MTEIPELIRWLKTLKPGNAVAIDDGGLAIVEIGPDGRPTDAYLEIGSISEDDEQD
jgi:hypothetical protein